MKASAPFSLLLSGIAAELALQGFRRKGAWFTRHADGDPGVLCIHVRRIPQPGSKRIVFQVLSFVCRADAGEAIGSLQRAQERCAFEHRMLEGDVEKFWTVWPSSDPSAICDAMRPWLAAAVGALRGFGGGVAGS